MGDGAVDLVVEIGESGVALGLCQGVVVPVCRSIECPGTIVMRFDGMRFGLSKGQSGGVSQRLVSSMPEPSVLADENSDQQKAEESPNGRDHSSGNLSPCSAAKRNRPRVEISAREGDIHQDQDSQGRTDGWSKAFCSNGNCWQLCQLREPAMAPV